MPWYAARELFEAVHPDESDEEAPGKLFEHSIVVLDAADEAEAAVKAQQSGEAYSHEYRNAYGKRVQWKLRGVVETVQLIDDGPYGDGGEVYWELLDQPQAKAMLRSADLPSPPEVDGQAASSRSTRRRP